MSTENGEAATDNEDRDKRRELLLKVYDAAVQEYRFNVQLSWDRAKFYLTLSITAIAAGVGLLRFAADSWSTSLFLAAYFGALIMVSWLGCESIQVGKRYFRQAILTKTLVERELGLLRQVADLEDPRMHLAIVVTPGMQDFEEIIFRHEQKLGRAPKTGTNADRLTKAFYVVIGIEIFGVILAWAQFVQKAFES